MKKFTLLVVLLFGTIALTAQNTQVNNCWENKQFMILSVDEANEALLKIGSNESLIRFYIDDENYIYYGENAYGRDNLGDLSELLWQSAFNQSAEYNISIGVDVEATNAPFVKLGCMLKELEQKEKASIEEPIYLYYFE